jgi:predicted AlkP superfamily pyrophosphatase or phosphodiesterase
MEKVILISIDGMRPDGFLNCGHPFIHRMMELGAYTLNARTVFPSVTLPCHMSLFHSVTPERHGITTNLYMPMVRPLRGLFEQLSAFRKVSAMYYGWEPLRDVARPESLKFAAYLNAYAEDATDASLTDMALERIRKSKPDFVFLYMVETDEKGGHDHGWMSQAYLDCISAAIDNVRRVYEEFGDEIREWAKKQPGASEIEKQVKELQGDASVHGFTTSEPIISPSVYERVQRILNKK